MKTWLTTIVLASLVLVSAASAAIRTGDEFLAQLQQQVVDGKMSSEQALLTKFYYAFDRERLPAELQPEGVAPLKCGTPLVMEYLRVQSQLSTATRDAIDGYLAPRDEPNRILYYSPGGHFLIYYYTAGTNAVPVADLNANGVPDYVERIGEYFDFSWQTEVVDLGFGMPPTNPYFTVLINALDGIYGFTQPTGSPGETTITIENDFVGFPPNDDPDGDVLGAAKVTAAHEFKHSTQYVTSHWSEGGWVEVDATWCEEIVYPATNDYHNYLPGASPISSPATPLDSGGTGSYEDCVWQMYMSDIWSVQIIIDFWNYRRSHQSEAVLTSYNTILNQYGSSIVACWPLFTTWNYATGARYVSPFGYHDGLDYPTGSPQRQMSTYPNTYNGPAGGVQHLAANFIRCLSLRQAAQPNLYPQVTFNGADAATAMSLTAFVRGYVSGYNFFEFDLDAANDGVFILPVNLLDVYEIGFIVGNGAVAGGGYAYSLTVERVDGQSTPVGEGVTRLFQIAGNHPNPFNPSTTIAFAVDQDGPAVLGVYDLRGQRIRTLLTENLTAGSHEVRWDGLDDNGRQLPSGTYLARLSSNGQTTTHKLVLAK
jgi:hypothetical protein